MKANISQQEIQQTAVRLGIPDHPFIHRRIARAFDLVATGKVSEIDDSIFRVKSQFALSACDRTRQVSYIVETNHFAPSCTCKDSQKTLFCKHQIASRLVENEQRGAIFACDRTRRQSRKPSAQNTPKLTRNFDYDAEGLAQRMAPRRRIAVKETPNPKVKASWVVVEDGRTYVNVWQDLNGKICCVCGAYYTKDCVHKQKIREFQNAGNCSQVVNECGTEIAKALQDKLNGSNGKVERTGVAFGEPCDSSNSHPSTQLDTSDPFQECEMLDIDQIEGRSNGDLVHKLSNAEYVISYNGIMVLAEQHSITFEASRHDETHTVIAYGRCGNNSRASGKPINDSEMTAVELAKRNVARQLLPLVEIKALEKKAQLEAEFDWQKAKAKCLEIVPDFTFDILIHDLVQAGTLRQAHPSDYNRKEWLVIFDACKRDAEINGNDDDGGANTPSSDEQVSCAICSRTLTNPESVRLQVGPECYKKVGAQGAQFLRDDEVSDELIKASKLYQDEALQKRILRACLTLDAPPPVKVLNWLGNEYFGYQNRPILYYVCAAGQLNRIDTHRRRLRHVIVTSETAETELDAHGLAQWSTQAKPRSACDRTRQRRVSPAVDVADPSERKAGRKAFRRKASASHRAEVPDNVDDFIAKCKELESKVDDTTDDNSVDDTATATMVEGAQMDGDGKRMLRMDKKKNILLIEPDGTETPITMRDAAFTYGSNYILRLTQGIACGGDISTVELDN